MSINYINTGSSANKGDGDTLRTAFSKINANFEYLSTATGGTGTYVLPVATSHSLGGVKSGTSILVSNSGTLYNGFNNITSTGLSFTSSVPDAAGVVTRTWQLLKGTTSTIGGVKSSPSILIDIDGSAQIRTIGTGSDGISYTDTLLIDPVNPGHTLRTWSLNPATTSTLGGIKAYPGGAIAIMPDGVIQLAATFVSGTGTQAYTVWPDDGVTPPVITYNVTPATGGALGGVKIGAGVQVDVDGTISVTTGAFALQTATNTILGGVKIGGGFSITPDGTISAQSPLVPIADTPPGGASDGELWWSSNTTNLYIRYSGAWIDASPTSGGSSYTLTTATHSALGGVIIGSGININGNGVISVTTGSYTLTTATQSSLGGVKIGAGINVDGNGVISVTTGSFALQTATTNILGGVKVGSGLSIELDGTLSATGTTGTQVVYVADAPPTPATEGELWWDSNTTNLYINYSGFWIDAVPATPPPSPYDLPTATQSVLGGVKVDGITITIDANGIISSSGGSGGGSTTWALLGNKNNSSGPDTLALGTNAGYNGQGLYGVALGSEAAVFNQGQWSVAIGSNAGRTNQSYSSVAIGSNAGYSLQGANSVAIGVNAGNITQGEGSVAIGEHAGENNQGNGGIHSVAVGDYSGNLNQGTGATAIGPYSGQTNQGAYAVALGYMAGMTTQTALSIVINATGSPVTASNSGLYIAPVRADATTSATTWGVFYNPVTKELTTSTAAVGTGSGGGGSYTLPIASTSTLGGIKIGTGFIESPAGVFNVSAVSMPAATTSTLGGIKVGPSMFINSASVLDNIIKNTSTNGIYITNSEFPDSAGYRTRTWGLRIATPSTLGGVAIGDNINISTVTGAISVPFGSTTTGVVKVYAGGSLGIDPVDGTIAFAGSFADGTGTQHVNTWPDDGITPPIFSFNLLPATTSSLGGVIADGTTITIDANGVISAVNSGTSFTVTDVSYFTNDIGYLTSGTVNDFVNSFTVTNVSYFINDVEYLTSSTLNQYVNATIVQSASAPDATTSTLWYDTVGGRQYIYYDNSWVDTNPSIAYTLPTASTSSIGGVQIGTGISIDNSGTISVVPATTATWATLADVNNANGPDKVALGANAGTTQQTGAIAIGSGAGNIQNYDAIAIGSGAGGFGTQGQEAVAIGIASGQTDQGMYAVAIGSGAGQNTQGSNAVAFGPSAGQTTQGDYAVAIGLGAGQNTQTIYAVAIGTSAGNVAQGNYAVAIGVASGNQTQGACAVAAGPSAGQFTQGASAVAIGDTAGTYTQGQNAVAVGQYAGQTTQGGYAVALGDHAGSLLQGVGAIAVGQDSGTGISAVHSYVSGGVVSTTMVLSNTDYIYPGSIVSGTGFTQGQYVVQVYPASSSVELDSVADGTPSGSLAFNSGQSEAAIAIGVGAGRYGQAGATVAIGQLAGNATQGNSAVAIGPSAGETSQGTSAVAIGQGAGATTQGANAIAIGLAAGTYTQGAGSVAIGEQAASGLIVTADYVSGGETTTTMVLSSTAGITRGMKTSGTGFNGDQRVLEIVDETTVILQDFNFAISTPSGTLTFTGVQDINAVAIGSLAGQTTQGENAVAIGYRAGNEGQEGGIAIGQYAGEVLQKGGIAIGGGAGSFNQSGETVAVGGGAGSNSQKPGAVAVGEGAGQQNQSNDTVAIGRGAGAYSQSAYAVAIGYHAGGDNPNGQAEAAIAIGKEAGIYAQGLYAVAIGLQAGANTQSDFSVAIGQYAGQTIQGQSAVALGPYAGQTKQGQYAVAIGQGAGQNTQSSYAVAIGINAGQTTQGASAVAIGDGAGEWTQGTNSVAIGTLAGENTQSSYAVAIGPNAGNYIQGQQAVAIGTDAGATNQGAYAVAIGSYAGVLNQPAFSIILNAGGNDLDGTNSGLYIDPIREDVTRDTVAYYNTATKEVTYGPAAPITTATLVNGLHTLTLNTDGAITTNGTDTNVYIETVGTDTTHLWTFDSTGTIVFPDGSQQTTAYQNNFGQPNQLISGTTVLSLISTATGYFNQGHSVNTGELDISTGTFLVFEGPLDTNNWTGAIGDGVSTGSLAIYTDTGPLELYIGGYNTKTSFEINGGFRPKILAAPPSNATTGTFFTADGVSWDPASKSGSVPYPVFYDGVAYNALY